MCRPCDSPWIRPAVVSSLRWNDRVAPASDSTSAISPGVRPSWPASTSKRKTDSRVGCPRAARAVVALISSIFLEYSNELERSKHGRTPRPGQPGPRSRGHPRSEEHTSELQSREKLVCRLLLEKKNSVF